MRLRWLLLAVVTMTLSSSLAAARSQLRPAIDLEVETAAPAYSIGAASEPGLHAGTLVIAFYNPDVARSVDVPMRVIGGATVDYDWLTVELSNATTSRTLRFVSDRDRSAVQTVRIEPRQLHFERIDLDPMTRDLPPGEYSMRVIWDGQQTSTTTTFVPFRCGLAASALPPVPPSPSKLPYVLGGLAIAAFLVGLRLAKRAGTADVRVPCSLP